VIPIVLFGQCKRSELVALLQIASMYSDLQAAHCPAIALNVIGLADPGFVHSIYFRFDLSKEVATALY
jgi:hypothetical protein